MERSKANFFYFFSGEKLEEKHDFFLFQNSDGTELPKFFLKNENLQNYWLDFFNRSPNWQLSICVG